MFFGIFAEVIEDTISNFKFACRCGSNALNEIFVAVRLMELNGFDVLVLLRTNQLIGNFLG